MTTLTRSFALVLSCAIAATPLGAFAATQKAEGSFTSSSLVSSSSKPTIRGDAEGTKTVKVEVRKEGSSKKVFTSKATKVKKSGAWSVKVSKKLADGAYDVRLVDSKKKTLAEDTLMVGKKAATANATFAVSVIPLLSGGVARAGSSVPVSYLQITNVGKESATLTGIALKQNGSANASAIIGLTTVDYKGELRASTDGKEGASPFKNGTAIAPTNAVFAPGQMRLFTVKAVLSSNLSAHVGKNLMLDVTGLIANAKLSGAFPMRGTTWTLSY